MKVRTNYMYKRTHYVYNGNTSGNYPWRTMIAGKLPAKLQNSWCPLPLAHTHTHTNRQTHLWHTWHTGTHTHTHAGTHAHSLSIPASLLLPSLPIYPPPSSLSPSRSDNLSPLPSSSSPPLPGPATRFPPQARRCARDRQQTLQATSAVWGAEWFLFSW